MAAIGACSRLASLCGRARLHAVATCVRGALAAAPRAAPCAWRVGGVAQAAHHPSTGLPASGRVAFSSASAAVEAESEDEYDSEGGEQPVDWTTMLPDNLQLHNPQDAMQQETLAYADGSVKNVEVVKFAEPGATAGEVVLDDRVFGVAIRPDIVHRVVQWQLSNRRTKKYKTKNISETRGGGRKPWPQKNLGRARAGSIRSAHWRGGPKAHGPKIRDWGQKLNKKIRRQGLAVALAAKYKERRLVVVDSFSASSHKTKDLAELISSHGWDEDRLLLIDGPEFDPTFGLAASNLKRVNLLPCQGANVFDIVKMDVLLVSQAGLEGLYGRLIDDFDA